MAHWASADLERLTRFGFFLSLVLHLCSVCELSRAQSENRRILYRQNEVQETQCSLFPIYRRLPKLDVNPPVGSLAGSGTINALRFADPLGRIIGFSQNRPEALVQQRAGSS